MCIVFTNNYFITCRFFLICVCICVYNYNCDGDVMSWLWRCGMLAHVPQPARMFSQPPCAVRAAEAAPQAP